MITQTNSQLTSFGLDNGRKVRVSGFSTEGQSHLRTCTTCFTVMVESVIVLVPQPLAFMGGELIAVNLFGLRLPLTIIAAMPAASPSANAADSRPC